jgi:GNAT superfamily N-acetyltransferase
MEINEAPFSRLDEFARISIAFEVRSVFEPELRENGLGGIMLHERPVTAYVKDYDLLDPPLTWPVRFDLAGWGLFLAEEAGQTLGGAVVAWDTPGAEMLEDRKDLSALWDLRVAPEHRGRGIGRLLFQHAVAWSKVRGCVQMKIETQNVNVPACRFYAAQGATLGSIRRFAYRAVPSIAHETQLIWYFDC